MRLPVLVLLLACGAAGAQQGVPLLTPGPAVSDSVRQSYNGRGYVLKLHPITLNKDAFGLPVINITIDGKKYVFTGSMVEQPPKRTDLPAGTTQGDSLAWRGKGEDGGNMTLSKSPKTGGVLGYIFIPPNRRFIIDGTLGGGAVLVERDPTFVPAPMQSVPDEPQPINVPGGRP